MIKILFLAANPKDSSPLRLGEEMRAIQERLRASEYREAFRVEQEWAVRVDDLEALLLRHKPHIVHFSGHGNVDGEILLENRLGNSQSVPPSAFKRLFSVLKDNIQCVVLNACFSKSQADAIAECIDCVVGMSDSVGDQAAILFASSFYQALGFGRNIQTAFDLACLEIELHKLGEQSTPKLIIAPGVDAKTLYIAPSLTSVSREGENVIHDRLNRSEKTSDSIFGVTNLFGLPGFLPNYPNLGIEYKPRGATEVQQEIEQLVENKLVIITGRTGLGKTREAIELIKRLESTYGETFTILIINRFSTEPLPPNISTRNMVLFIDDLHLLAQRFRGMGLALTLEEWMRRVLSYLDSAASGRLWVICTLRDEPGLKEAVDLEKAPWKEFYIYHLLPISKEVMRDVVFAVAAPFGINVLPDALKVLTERCDGTFMSLIAYFSKKIRCDTKILDDTSVQDFSGTYPLIWKTDYERFIKRNKVYNAIFQALAILRQLGITPEVTVVTDLARRIYGIPIVGKVVVLRAIPQLRAWLEVQQLQGRREFALEGISFKVIRCADAYLQDFVGLNEIKYRKQAAEVIVNFGFGEFRDNMPGNVVAELKESFFLLTEEAAPLMKKQLYGITNYKAAMRMISVALFLTLARRKETVPLLMTRLNTFMHINRLNFAVELAIDLGHMGESSALPLILKMINQLSPGPLRNDVIQTLPSFQDRKSLLLIIDTAVTWEEYDHDYLTYTALQPFYFTQNKTDEEIAEEREMNEWEDHSYDGDKSVIINRAINSPNERVRFRGYFAAGFYSKGDKKVLLKGLLDESPKIRGATLLLIEKLGGSSLLAEKILSSQLSHLAHDDYEYDGLRISEIAQSLEHLVLRHH